jgi:hypothetical protein
VRSICAAAWHVGFEVASDLRRSLVVIVPYGLVIGVSAGRAPPPRPAG